MEKLPENVNLECGNYTISTNGDGRIVVYRKGKYFGTLGNAIVTVRQFKKHERIENHLVIDLE